VTPPEPDGPQEPHRSGRDGAPPPARTGHGPRRILLVLGLVAALAGVAFTFAPVEQPQVTYSWTASDGAAAIPLMPYQPVDLHATVDCAAARGPVGELLLSTTPPRPDPEAAPLSGLRLATADGGLRVTSAGVDLGTVPLPAGGCTVTLDSDHTRTTVAVDGRTVLTHDGDVRPDVAGAFTDVRAGVRLALDTDTRFQTTVSPLKAAIAAICVLALLGMLVVLGRIDRAAVRSVRLLPRGWWRPRAVDVVVTALLAVWWLIGSLTVDDGYISGIIRSRGENGFIGNIYRWLNAPEAPFSWFYDVFYLWSRLLPGELGNSTLWMRLPSTLLGIVCWWLLSRGAVPRLGRFATRRWTPWLAALTFATWWIPLNLGLRPEPWVTVGLLGVFLAVERAIATRRVLPLAVGMLVAGVTTALTPGGLIAFMPFLAGLLPVLRVLRSRRDLHVWPLVIALVAAPSVAVLFMLSDQSLASMLESTRVRTLIGGGMPWFQEFERYANLLEPGSFQGSIGKRAAVLFTLLAAAGVMWALHRGPERRNRAGIAPGPAGRLVTGFGLGLLAMTFTPTKWTQHFGDFAGTGAAVLLLGLVLFAAGPLKERPRALVTGLAAVTGVGGLVLAGYNIWPYASNWFSPTFSSVPPQLAGKGVSAYVLAVGGLLVTVLLVRSAWLRAGGATAVGTPRRVPAPGPVTAVALVAVLLLQVGGLARVAVDHRDSYTLASDGLATLRGEPCGLERLLSVETDPSAGLLSPAGGSMTGAERTVDVGGTRLPGIAVSGTTTTGWFTLDPAQRDDTLPVVVTTSGTTRPSDRLTVEYGSGGQVIGSRSVTSGSDTPTDVRLMAPPGADSVRLAVTAPTAGPQPAALVSLPRVPRLTPMETLLPPGSSAVLDWPVAFLFGCIEPTQLPLGTASLPTWEVGPPATDPSAGITYAPSFGGPFAAPRLLVTEQRMATYLAGDPLRDAAQLFRWTPVTPMITPTPVVAVHSVAGWHSDGRTRVPGLDPVG
jgi:arabinosyltransferase A/arabinosyltransferase B/arabinosyltransferase C